MGKSTLVTGGARSGKSGLAERLAKEAGGRVMYIATSVPFDDEMRKRVERHRENRPSEWTTFEGYKDLGKVIAENSKEYDAIIIDCITVMVTNLLFEKVDMNCGQLEAVQVENAEEYIMREISALMKSALTSNTKLFMVTNEIGSGIVPENVVARAFRDIAGRVNQFIASKCDEVYLTVCGIPVKVK